jgi:iron complex outermembrane receptor protein
MLPVEVFSLLKNTDQRTWGGMLRYNAKLGDQDLVAGLNLANTRETGGLHRNDGGKRNGLRTIVDNRSDSVEVFLVDRWKIAPAWTLVYGAQGVFTGSNTDRQRQLRNEGRLLVPRIGVIRALTPASEVSPASAACTSATVRAAGRCARRRRPRRDARRGEIGGATG